ncbi:hypothetical protein JCM10213_007545, partial [Rhodosporidiobolus nylandii]
QVMKAVAGSLKLYLAQYRDVAAFAQFGSDLDASTRFLLNRGSRLTELLKQGQYQARHYCPLLPLPIEVQVPIIYAGVNGLLDRVPVEKIGEWEASFKQTLQGNQALLAKVGEGKMTPELDAELKKTVVEHVSGFVSA